jgi:thiamine-phosphate pyrophosphorylase
VRYAAQPAPAHIGLRLSVAVGWRRVACFEKIDICPVTCERLSSGRYDLEILDGLIKGGARIVQLREKDICERDFFRLAEVFRERTAKAGMLIIGASSHNLQEALRAQEEGTDYVNIGPVFPTGTKEGVEHFPGPGAITQAADIAEAVRSLRNLIRNF